MRNTFRVVAVLVVCLAASAPLWAQGLTRVYVSETDGNDVPPCGPIKKPCQTFQYSMTHVAPQGRIIVLDTGEYGPVKITKSVTIEAPPGVNALIQDSATDPLVGRYGVAILAGPADVVTLRGIKIAVPIGTTHAIAFQSAAAMYVEKCVVDGGVDGIDVLPFNFTGDVNVFISGTVVSNSGGAIRVLKGSATTVRATIDHSQMEGNFEGLTVADGAQATARECTMTRNRSYGVDVGSSTGVTTQLAVESCVISGNNIGIGSTNADSIVRVSNSTITDNRAGIVLLTATAFVFSRGNNTLEANGVDGVFSGPYASK